MATCAHCNRMILFGGVSVGQRRYCNTSCQKKDTFGPMVDQLPTEAVEEALQALHGGKCPQCGGDGPVDVHFSHRVHSLVVMTSWSSRVTIGCPSCARREQTKDLLYSLFLGWWGVPFGALLTPVQIIRNVIGMVSAGGSAEPSEHLRDIVRAELVARVYAYQQQERKQQESAPAES